MTASAFAIASRQGDDMSSAIANEAQEIVRRVAETSCGTTTTAKINAACRALDYPINSWRINDAWCGRAGSWSAAAIVDLQQRYVAWRDKEART